MPVLDVTITVIEAMEAIKTHFSLITSSSHIFESILWALEAYLVILRKETKISRTWLNFRVQTNIFNLEKLHDVGTDRQCSIYYYADRIPNLMPGVCDQFVSSTDDPWSHLKKKSRSKVLYFLRLKIKYLSIKNSMCPASWIFDKRLFYHLIDPSRHFDLDISQEHMPYILIYSVVICPHHHWINRQCCILKVAMHYLLDSHVLCCVS